MEEIEIESVLIFTLIWYLLGKQCSNIHSVQRDSVGYLQTMLNKKTLRLVDNLISFLINTSQLFIDKIIIYSNGKDYFYC